MLESHGDRSVLLRRLQSQKDRLNRLATDSGEGAISPQLMQQLDEIDLIMEEVSRGVYRVD